MTDPPELSPAALRRARARAGNPAPSQRDVAALFGVTQPLIAYLERGRRQVPRVLVPLYLALVLATARPGVDLRRVFDRRAPEAERLAVLFRVAYPEER